MKNGRIGIIMAMREELHPLLSRVDRVRRDDRAGMPICFFHIGKYEVSAIKSGMGMQNGIKAARMLVEQCSPDLLINAGFAGSITGEPTVGDIVLADRVLLYHNGRFDEEQRADARLTAQATEVLSDFPDRFRALHGTFITTEGIAKKSLLATALSPPVRVAVVDMETTAVARVAAETGTPFLAIRAISDGADEELGFSIGEITDSTLEVSIPKVIGTIARKPWIVPQMVRLARNSRRAGVNLADALLRLLTRL